MINAAIFAWLAALTFFLLLKLTEKPKLAADYDCSKHNHRWGKWSDTYEQKRYCADCGLSQIRYVYARDIPN